MTKPSHPDAEPDRPGHRPEHDLPGRGGTHPEHESDRPTHGRPEHPEHDLPGKPVPPGRPGTHPEHDLPEKHDQPEKPAPKSVPPPPEPKRGPGPGGRAVAPRSVDDPLPPPTVSALLPPSAAIGDPSFMVRVIGSGFDQNSVINFAEQDEPTTFVSEEELTTGVNMDVWLAPDPALQVLVRNADGQTSNALLFALTPARAVPLDPAYASIPTPVIVQI